MKLLKFNTIRTRLTFWLILIAFFPFFVSLVSTYVQRSNEIEKDNLLKLSTIRDLKVQQLDEWLDQRINEVGFISEQLQIKTLESLFEKNVRTPQDHEYIAIAQKIIKHNILDFKDFSEISYIDATSGLVMLSTREDYIGINQTNNLFFKEPLKTGELFIKDIHVSNLTNKNEMTLSKPVYCMTHKTHIIGVLMVRINLDKSLYKLLNNRVGLGKTGETLIVNDEVMALNELRWFDNAPLNLKIKAAPAIKAADGATGVIKDFDYRGIKVLAAYAHISKTGWGFVCKQDMKELREPIRNMLKNYLVLFIVIAFFAIYLAWYLAKHFSKPIISIHKVTKRIKAGDFSVRNTIESTDELGLLAEEFNNMADYTEAKIKLQQGVSEISNTIINQGSMLSFGKQIIRVLMRITKANMAVFYVLNESEAVFEHFTSIGANPEILKTFDADNHEGEFGGPLFSQEINHLKNIPSDTLFKFNTSAGQIIPKEIITIPIVIENSVVALISLTTINKFSKTSQEIIHASWMAINTSYSSLLANERTSILAENLARMNHQLESQTEELRSTSEELYDQNIELEKQRKKVEEANRLKSEFLSNMSHELRTPLNSINTLSQVLIKQAQGKLNMDEANYLEIIERNGKNLLALINDILDLSRIEAGKMDIMPQAVSLNSLLNTVKDILITMAENKGLSITLDIPQDLPKVESDEMRLHQVLLNIVGNAVKFTDKGSIKISAKAIGKKVVISIEDSGIGIPKEMLPYVFDEFRQVDGSATRSYEGTGLGLAIAHKLIKILGGDIEVSSRLDIGTCFTVSVPMAWFNHTLVQGNVEPDPLVVNSNINTLLIIEDDKKIANEIAEYIHEAGFGTRIAHTSEDALELLNNYDFYAITLDIYLPGADGWNLLQALKTNPKTKAIPVIMVTISADKSTGFALGAVGYVSKPILKESLLLEIYNINKSPHTLLIIDDNEIELMEMANMIREERFETLTAKGGKEGLQIIKNQAIDLLILDLMMPDMDGFQVLHELRKNPDTQFLPVVIVTAKHLSLEDKQQLDGQVSSILTKSDFSISKLNAEIEKIIKHMEVAKKIGQPYVVDPINKAVDILIVEDNMDNMTTIKALLGDRYKLSEAYDGLQGLEKSMAQLPDLILLDMSLPKLDGIGLVKKLKEEETTKNIPVVAVSARAMKGDKEKYLAAGCNDFVPKPIDGIELNDKITKWLNK